MVIMRLRSKSEMKDMLRKLKKMEKFTRELVDCFEEKVDDEYDDDEDYREDEDYESERPRGARGGGMNNSYRRYRRSM